MCLNYSQPRWTTAQRASLVRFRRGACSYQYACGNEESPESQVNPKLSLLVIDPQNGGHWIEIQGKVGELKDEVYGAREHINKLSEKYTGNPVYQAYAASGIDRQMYVIEAVKINGH